MEKKQNNFRSNFGQLGQIPAKNFFFFFFENLAWSVTRYLGQLSSGTISEKSNDSILRKLSNGETDGETDGQMEESDFIGCCQTNVEQSVINDKTKTRKKRWT